MMQAISQAQFADLLLQAKVKPRLRREVRFRPDEVQWADSAMFAATDRAGNAGVLVVPSARGYAILPFTISRGIVDKQTGRSKPITCDFCMTWQAGGNAARISFGHADSLNSRTFLCCADLLCSQHVRTKTKAAELSRTQLHEDLTNDQRVARLAANLESLIARLSATLV